MFKALGKVLKGAIGVAAPVVLTLVQPEALLNTAVMGGVKHATKVSNQSIPYLNLLMSCGIKYAMMGSSTGDWAGSIMPALQAGGVLAGMSTAIHQSLKIPTKGKVEVMGQAL